MNLFLIVVIMGLIVIIFFIAKNNEKSTQKVETKNTPSLPQEKTYVELPNYKNINQKPETKNIPNTFKNTPSLSQEKTYVELPNYKDIKEFDSIQELKIYIKKEMEDRIGLVENVDIPFIYQRKDSNEINANITLKKNSKLVYIYIDFNLMYKDSSWNKTNIINLNLCINDESLKSELLKVFTVNNAYSIRDTYITKSSDQLSEKYCGDLKITSLKDLEKVLKISRDLLKN